MDEKIYFKLLNTVFLSFTLLGEWEGSQVFVLPCHLTPPTLHTTVGVDTHTEYQELAQYHLLLYSSGLYIAYMRLLLQGSAAELMSMEPA